MAAVNFPNSPSVNDTHTSSGSTWKWDGTVWQRLGVAGPQGAQGVQGANGAAGAQGAQGHQGVQGSAGSNGAAGAQGHQGVQGAANATTINNNANNRVITGSGTANTLEAESDFTWDNSTSILSVGNQIVRIGSGNAGQNSGSRSTTVGNYCGQSSGGYSCNVGGNNVGNSAGGYSVNLGGNAIGSNAGQYSINIGGNATGYSNAAQYSINIGGQYTGYSNAGEHCINIGYSAGYQSGGKYGVNIGYNAGNWHSVNSSHNVAVGYEALKWEGSNKYCIGIGASCYLPIQGSAAGGAADNQLVIGVGHTAWIVGTKNYNIGLGVTNPSSKLQVQEGDIKIQNNASGTDGLFMRNATSTFAWTGEHENTAIPNGAIGMIITNSDVATNKSASLLEFRTYRNSATANPGVVYIGAVDIGDGTTHSSDMIFALKDGSATVIERMRINHDGKLLVGSDTLRTIGGSGSNGRVQIEGTSTNLSSLAIINNQNNTNASHLNFGKTRGTSTGAVTTVADGDNLGMIRWSGADGTDLENSTAVIKAIVNGTVSGNTIPTDIVFQTSATSGSAKAERLRITSGGALNIGVGNESSAVENLVELYVGGNNTSHATIRGKYNRSNEYNRSEVRFGVEDNSAGKGFLAFATGTNSASERLRIDSSGKIKLNQADSMIMTNADTSRLRLFGGSSNSVSNGAALTLQGVSHSSGNYVDLASATGGHIQFRTGTSERLRIKSDGNIIPGTNNATSIGDGSTNFNSIWASTRFRGNDNVKLVLGASQDLVIRHDGTDNIIGSPVGGDLHIKSGTGDNDNQLIASFKHSNASVGIGIADPTELFHVQKNHNGHTRAIIQNNWGSNATAQLKLISPTDEFQLVKYAAGAAALNLSNNSRIYHSVGGEVRHQITADSAGQTACVVNTPADGGVRSQYLTASKAKSGNYTTFQIDIDQTSWGSFYMKVYISGYSGDSCHKWVAGYCNNGIAGIHTPLSNMTSSFSGGSGTLTHVSGQTWKYVIVTGGSNNVTHPVMGVEMMFGGNGNMLDTGSISLSIS